jgi:hypothetical protein
VVEPAAPEDAVDPGAPDWSPGAGR